MAVASSSKNANGMMRSIRDRRGPKPARHVRCQRLRTRPAERQAGSGDFSAGCAQNCTSSPAHCFVVEDAPAGIEAARGGGMTALGVARLARCGAAANSGRGPGGHQSRRRRDRVHWPAGRMCRQPRHDRVRIDGTRVRADRRSRLGLAGADGYDSLREASVESRFAISNGFLGVRGAATDDQGRALGGSRPHLRRRAVRHARHGPRSSPGLVPAADWLQYPHPAARAAHCCTTLAMSSSHRMTLDMRRGALLSEGVGHGSEARSASGRPCAHVASRIAAERAIGLQLIRIGDRGRARSTSRSKLRSKAPISSWSSNGSGRISASGGPTVRASASRWRRARRCRSTARAPADAGRRADDVLDVDDAATGRSCVSSAAWPWLRSDARDRDPGR